MEDAKAEKPVTSTTERRRRRKYVKDSELNAMIHNSKACFNFVRAFGGDCERNDSCCNDDGEKCDHTEENRFSNGDGETVLEKRTEDLCLEAKASRDSTGYRYFGKSMQANAFNVRVT